MPTAKLSPSARARRIRPIKPLNLTPPKLIWTSDDRVIIVLPPSHPMLHSHNKGHWSKRNDVIKAVRFGLKVAVSNSLLTRFNPRSGKRFKAWPAAAVDYTFYFGDDLVRDAANAIHSMKPAIDGIVDAGLIVDDCWQRLKIGCVSCELDRQHPRVSLTFTRQSR